MSDIWDMKFIVQVPLPQVQEEFPFLVFSRLFVDETDAKTLIKNEKRKYFLVNNAQGKEKVFPIKASSLKNCMFNCFPFQWSQLGPLNKFTMRLE